MGKHLTLPQRQEKSLECTLTDKRYCKWSVVVECSMTNLIRKYISHYCVFVLVVVHGGSLEEPRPSGPGVGEPVCIRCGTKLYSHSHGSVKHAQNSLL